MDINIFKLLHRVNSAVNINKEARINVNYDLDPTDSNKGIITGVTITVKTKADWNQNLSTTNEIDLENVLLNITTLRFTVDSQVITLPIVSRARLNNYLSNTDNDYYYFGVTPTVVNIIPNGTVSSLTSTVIDVTLLPYIQDERYEYSDYNPLISNALNNRTSTYIQQSDRVGSGVSPTNLEEILAGSATLAQIQDSNYSSTGWSNARYVGSTTNAEEYKGIPSAITAKTFTAEINPSTSADLLICSRSLSDRILTELLHTGGEEIPTFEGFVETRYSASLNGDTTQEYIPYAYRVDTSQAESGIEIGSIIQISGSGINEKMRVTKIEPELERFQVTRGYLGTTPESIDADTLILVLKPLRIFTIDNTSAKIVNTANAKVWVRDSKEILSTDEYGLVYTGSNVCTV
jgi:hypothetical protein